MGTYRRMPPLPQTTAAALAKRAKDLLKDAAELTSGRDPNYIRDAQPDSVFEAIPLAAARQGCRRYADKPDQYSGLRQARVERACRPYLDSLEYGEAPAIELPFRGGQCAGRYLVNFSFGGSLSGNQTGVALMRGPIGGSRLTVNPDGGRSFQIFASGYSPGFVNCGGVATTAPQWFTIGGMGPNQEGYFGRINSVSACDTDECGNPPPDIVYPPNPTPGPTREPFTRAPDIDIDIDVTVNPDLTIDVDFGTGPVTIDPFGDEEGGGGGGTGPGEPGDPSGTGPGGDAEGEAPEGQILTGLRINFVEPPIGGKEYAPGVYRGVCYIYMGTADGLDHDPAGAMLRDGQFVYAEKDYLTRWVVSANMGYNLRVTPYYRPADAEG